MSSANPSIAAPAREAAQTLISSPALEVIGGVHRAIDPPELLECLMRATEAIGATASIYTIAIPEGGSENFSFTLFACHPGFAQRLCRPGSLLDHPWYRCACTQESPATDRQVRIEHPGDADALELARQYGFASCLIVPTASSIEPQRIEMLCVGSERSEAFEGSDARVLRMLARTLAAELHDWVTRHLSENLRQSTGLHQIDIELLKLERQGLGTKEISLKTGMTPASVNSRFQRLIARLDCPSRKAAARRAAAYGILDPH